MSSRHVGSYDYLVFYNELLILSYENERKWKGKEKRRERREWRVRGVKDSGERRKTER